MLLPRLFLGRADVAALLMAHSTYQDDGGNYDLLAQTDRFAPAGIGGECAFYMAYVAVNTEADATPLVITPIIDEVRQTAINVTVVSALGARKRKVIEVSLLKSLPNTVTGYATNGLFAPRGCWFQIEVATAFPADAAFIDVDAVELEFDVVREGKVQGVNP